MAALFSTGSARSHRAAVGVIAALAMLAPAVALGADTHSLPVWLRAMIQQAPAPARQMMESPAARQMMASPVARRMMAEHETTGTIKQPSMQRMMSSAK